MADATLAAVVGAQDQDGVFQRDDEDQGPEHEREDAEHRAWLQGGVPARRFGGLLEGIERAGADITIDDAEGAKRRGERQAMMSAVTQSRRMSVSVHCLPSRSSVG
jgi:hypothetical protein